MRYLYSANLKSYTAHIAVLREKQKPSECYSDGFAD
jgi:hypothetical protein